MRFKAQDIDNEHFYQLPKSLFSYKCFDGLDLNAKVIYAVLKDRMNLSRVNGWVEKNGDIFLMFSYNDLAMVLGVSKATICRGFKKLSSYGLIETAELSKSGAQKIYINRIEPPQTMAEVHDYEARLGKAENGTTYETDRFTDATACFTGETPRYAGATPRFADETPPVSPVKLNKTNLSSNTDLESLNRENTTTAATTKGLAPAEDETVNDSFGQIVLAYRENISSLTGPIVIKELRKLCQEHGLEQVEKAITEAALSAKGEASVKYIRAILSRWQKERSKPMTSKRDKSEVKQDKPVAVAADEPRGDYDDEGNYLPPPLPGENAQQYFDRLGIK